MARITQYGNLTAAVISGAGGALAAEVFEPRLPVPANVGTKMIAQANQAGHGFTQTGTGTSNLNDMTDAPLGSQSISMTTAGAGANQHVTKTGLTIDLTGQVPVVWVKVDDFTNLANLFISIGDAGFANFIRWTIDNNSAGDPFPNDAHWMQNGRWYKVTLNWAEADLISGSPRRLALTDIRLTVQDDNRGVRVTAHLAGFESQPEPTTVWPNGVVVICFDDNYLSMMTGAAYMDKYGFPGTAFVIVDAVGRAGQTTLAQLQQLRDNSGWDIASHAATAVNHNAGFDTLTQAQLDAEMIGMKRWAAQNGFRQADHFAWPRGRYNDLCLAEAKKFFASARTTATYHQETWPPADLLRTRTWVHARGVTLAQSQARIDNAYNGHQPVILTFHKLAALAADSITWDITSFNALMDYIAAKGIPVRTMSEMMRGQVLGPMTKMFSATTTLGVATVFPTSNGRALGTALFGTITGVEVTAELSTATAVAVPVASEKAIAADRRSVTVNVITGRNMVALGDSVVFAPNGTKVYVQITGF
jgi:peptidoglycan/xylan/chitin deacetylase (PgdA/CDA1 family)